MAERYMPGQDVKARPIHLYINFNFWDPVHQHRREYVEFFKGIGTMKNHTAASEYLEDITKSKFVLSPRGRDIIYHEYDSFPPFICTHF
jgi:hypothetical protein